MRIVMMGTGTFAEPTFEALLSNFGGDVVGLVTQPQRDGGNKRGSTRQTGKGMANIARAAQQEPDAQARVDLNPCLRVGLLIASPESINTPEGIAALRDMRPDLMVVAAYGQILSKDVLTIPTVGTINVHASLLPKYRGAAPVAYAILNGETQTGVTIIKVTPGLDSGDMILQESLDILPDETTGELEARLAVLGARLAVEAVRKYQSGEPVIGVKQDPALVTKAPKTKKEHGLIDWSKSAEEICRHVRAMQPWPTAYTFLYSASPQIRLIVTKARLQSVPEGLLHAQPGHVIEIPGSKTRLCAVAGDWKLVELIEVQPAGKKRMMADEFLRGHRIQLFDRFGPETLP